VISPLKIRFFCALIWGLSPVAFAAGISGQIKSTTDFYTSSLGSETDDTVPYLQLDVNYKKKFKHGWRTQWHVLGLSNLVAEGAPEKLYFDLPEAFIEKKIRKFKFRAGMDTLNWGVVDVSSPSDTVNTSALFQPLRTLKRGAPMLEASYDREAFSVDAVYIPVQRRPVLPAEDSRWLPRKVLVNINTDILGNIELPDPISYNYDPPIDLKNSLINNYGAKIASHLGQLDLQATYFEGAAPSPKVRGDFTLNNNVVVSPIHVAPVNYRVRTTGVGFVWAREKWIFRGESAYQSTINDNPVLQPWSNSNVLAAETNLELGSSTMTLLGQYYYARNPQAADNLISSTYRLFDRTAVLGARWAYSEKTLITASSLYETQTKGVYWSLGFERKITDSLKWALSYRDFSGREDGLLKTYDKNDHFSFELTYYF
jgi:hypothetical protein